MNPLISLITPTLNAERYIAETLRSVNAQDYPNLEHIIVDGGSGDATLALIENNGTRVTEVIRDKDSGTSEAINKGFSIAKGDFIWVLNADDSLENHTTLSMLSAYLRQNPQCDFVFGNMRMINDSGLTIGYRRFRHEYGLVDLLADRRHLPFAGCLLRRSALEWLRGFDTNYSYANDLEFYLRLAHLGQMQHIEAVTGVFRLHSAASTSKNIMATGRETYEVCERYLDRHDLPAPVQRRKQAINAGIQLHAARVHFHAGTPQEVQYYIHNALKLDRRIIFSPSTLIYFIASLSGKWGMTHLASLSRGLLHKKIPYTLNNSINSLPWSNINNK